LELKFVKFLMDAAALDEFLVATRLGYFSLVEYDNQVGE